MSAIPQSVAYKESGIPWVGKIPEHWEQTKLKFLANFYTGDSIKDTDKYKYCFVDNAIPYISTKDIDICSNAINYQNGMFIKNNDTEFKRAYKNSILLCLEGANAGKKVGFLNQEVCFVNKLCCISSKSENINSKLLFYFFQSIYFRDVFFSNIKGIIGGVTTEQIGNFYIPLPPLEEQKAIADFLDKKTQQIEELITKKQRLITLLEEKKQTLINQCVTQGLDTNAKLKESGIKWLGKIPTHWEVIRLGIAYPNMGSGTTPKSDESKYYDNGNIVWVNSGDLNDSLLVDSEKKITREALIAYPTLKMYSKFSIVVAMYGATIGKTSVLGVEACVNQACCVLPKSRFFEYSFVFYWFIGNKKHILEMGVGGGQPNISQEIIKNLKIPLPPLEEQKAIAKYLDTQIAKIDLAICKIKSQIHLIKEYKTTLITEAVCGRIDV